MAPLAVGVIGCGNIADSYLRTLASSELVRVVACASLGMRSAEAKARQYGLRAMPVDDLLADRGIDVVVNLTVPAAHAGISARVLTAGKHLYSEKPLATMLDDGRRLLALAAARGLRVGCAPDTFLGAAHQAARRLVDDGAIGTVVSGTASILSRGMLHWHPNPAFFFAAGGGPLLDVAPYAVTQLVNLVGPVAAVAGLGGRPFAERRISSAPLRGTMIPVAVDTTVTGLLSFVSGAQVVLRASWDVWAHQTRPLELYGSEGSLVGADAGGFGGAPLVARTASDWTAAEVARHGFGTPNATSRTGQPVADYRGLGLLDMAAALRDDRPHRADGALALHVLDILLSLTRATEENRWIRLETSCPRPAPMPLLGEAGDPTV
jgi:predicted dehydrogenase